jgi:Arc/MetJ-type ribon-helix-helix transcriptional regulator
MEAQPTPDQQAFIRDAIAGGRLRGPEEAMQKALLLWEERERMRLELLAAVELSTASLARGEGRTVTTREESDQLVGDITRRGAARNKTRAGDLPPVPTGEARPELSSSCGIDARHSR